MKIKIALISLFLVLFFVFILSPVEGFAQNQAVLPGAGLTPESPFYFLDKLGETLLRFFTFNTENKARLEIDFAKERIAEIISVLGSNGVSAKGLSVAEQGLSDDLSRAVAILTEQKQAGKDTNNLAKELSNNFDPARETLKNTFKSGIRVLDAKIDELKTKLKEVRLAGNTAQAEALSKEIADLKAQKQLLKQHEDKDDGEIENGNDNFDEALGLKEAAAEKIKEAEEEKADILKEAQDDKLDIPEGAFKEFDNTLSQAKAAFDAGNYEDAKRLAKEAKKSLKDVEKHLENLKDAKEEEEDLNEESDIQQQELKNELNGANNEEAGKIREEMKQKSEELKKKQEENKNEQKQIESQLDEVNND